MKKIARFLSFFKQDQKGNVLIMVALAMIALMGMAALVIDVGQLYAARRQMVNAADAGALAGVLEAKNNEKFAREAAKDYAEENHAENFCEDDDVFFTGEGEFRTISVRTSKRVDYTFARVLGFDSSIVQAVASAQVGPGNPLVPFVDVGWECDECCQCFEECQCENGEEFCDCADECQCDPDPKCDECGGLGYFMRTVHEGEGSDPEDYKRAEKGDRFEIKYERWQDWFELTSGNYPYIRLPDQDGAQDLYENLAGGYTGDLEDVKPGTVHQAQTGNIAGKLREAMLTRMTIHGVDDAGDYCSFENHYCGDWYKCDLVVVLPLVIEDPSQNKHYEIVGYATVLLDGNEYDGEKYVWVWFIEYLTYDELEKVLTEKLEGFVTKLVRDPQAALDFFSNNSPN